MTLSKKSILRKGATLALMTAIVFGSSVPAFAADTVGLEITPGSFTVATGLSATPNFGTITTSFTTQSKASTNGPTFTVTDATGEVEGWSVMMESSPLLHSASVANNLDLPATAVTVSGLAATTYGANTGSSSAGMTAPADALNIATTGGQAVLTAAPGSGQGTYTRAVTLSIALPANVRVGTFSGTLTTTTVRPA